MAIVIICAGMAGIQINSTDVPVGQYLEEYDPDFMAGAGRASWTTDLAKAKRFPDVGAALAEWKRTSAVRPIRGDGRPNRPMTAYHITFATVV